VLRIEFSPGALRMLDRLVELYELPPDSRSRVVRYVAHLGAFPDSGAPLGGEWEGYRFVLGPWPWLAIIYEIVNDQLVAIVAFEDTRGAGAATGQR
jgi:hypothetical protein